MSARPALLGAAALSVVNFLKYALQLAVIPIMARLLDPAAFGIVALAMPFILLANLLADGGMGSALVREQAPSRELESTVFWLSLAIGVGLTLLALAIAWPMAAVLHQPKFAPILMGLAPIMTIGAALSVPNARIMRERRFELFAIGEMTGSVLSAVVGISAALAGWGAWSLVAAQLALWLTKAVWLPLVSRHRPVAVCRPSLARPLIAFGLNTVGANVSDFGSKNLAPLVIGALLGVTAVGHYSLGWQLNRIPDAIISGPIYLTVFTGIAAAGAERELVLRPLRMLVVVLAPLFGGLAVVSDLAVRLFLGDQWSDTAPVLAALAPAGFLLCLYSIVSAALMGLGQAGRSFQLTLATGAAILIGVFIGSRFGLTGAALGLSLGCLAVGPLYAAALCRGFRLSLREALAGMGGPALATVVMIGAVMLVRSLIDLPDILELAFSIATGIAAYAAVLAPLGGPAVLADLRQIRRGSPASQSAATGEDAGAGRPAAAARTAAKTPSPAPR